MSDETRRTDDSAGRAEGDPAAGGEDRPPHDSPRAEVDPDRPATYGEVFASSEYRALFAASALSWIGDFLAKVALAFLVYRDTNSLLLSASAFAVTYLPWIAGGPVLAAVAERYPYRRVMILCDLARMGIIALIAIPGIPLPLLPLMMFCAAMLTPPFESARSALLPRILDGDRYVVGLAAQNMAHQSAQIVGYVSGGVLSAIDPRVALLIDSLTFAVSALIIWRGVKPRPALTSDTQRTHLLRETGEGFTVVFGNPVLRSIAIVVFSVVCFSIVPEGLAAGWATELGQGAMAQGVLMAANPVGVVIGGFVVGRMLAPSVRQRLIRPLAILAPAALVPALFSPPLVTIFVMVMLTGFATSALLPANGLFVRALPDTYRARAFGVMQGGIAVLQGLAVLSTGAAGSRFSVPIVVGVWSVFGVALLGVLALVWPSQETIQQAVDEATQRNRRRDAANRSGATGPTPEPPPEHTSEPAVEPPPSNGQMNQHPTVVTTLDQQPGLSAVAPTPGRAKG